MDDFAAALGLKTENKNSFDVALEKEGVLGTPKEHFIRSLYQQESSAGKNTQTSNAGAVGGMQVIPATFKSVADKNWNIADPEHNARAGIRYALQLLDMSKGDEKAAAAGYYGGPNGLIKAQQGIAVRDPRNPNAPTTLQYGEQVADRANVMRDSSDFESALFGKQAPEEEAKIAKKEEKDKLSSFAAGFGGAISKTAGAIEQLAGKGIGLVAPEAGKKIEQHALEQIKKTQEITEPFIQANPKTALAGEAAGLILNPVNKVIPGGQTTGMAGTLAQGAAQGAAVNVLTTPVTDENKSFLTEKLKQAFIGGTAGAVGAGVIKGAGALAEPVTNALSDVGQKAVKTLRDAGVPVDVAQATGSAFLNRTKAALMDNPFTAGKEEAFAATQKAAYNKAIAKTMGEDATAITPDVIQKAKDRLGENYNQIASRNKVILDEDLQAHLNSIKDRAEQVLTKENFPTIDKAINNIVNKANANNGQLDGQQYQAIKEVLDDISAGGGREARYAKDLKEALLSGLSRSAEASGNKADVALLKETNRQYSNMKKIEDVVLKNPQGDVSPSLLSNSLATKGKRYSIYQDDPELANLARAGKLVLEQKLPNSGTMARFLAQNQITALIKAGYGKTAQAVMNNPAAAQYLEQGVAPGALRNILNIPKAAGAYVPTYAAKPGVAGATALREMINLRNREQQ